MTSVFDLFKIGIRPSSSHTVGPMVAARRFRDALPEGTVHITAELFGSLAWIGRGHASDQAISLGLMGAKPDTIDPDEIPALVARLTIEKCIEVGDDHVAFDVERDLILAAAGPAAVLGASPEQVENAAEIAMEHHLGMTCDPVDGLVQIPCIERNAFGANKAVAAAALAMRGNGIHHVSLDQVIETMRQTGVDMQSKYKETSQGGLAVNVPEC